MVVFHTVHGERSRGEVLERGSLVRRRAVAVMGYSNGFFDRDTVPASGPMATPAARPSTPIISMDGFPVSLPVFPQNSQPARFYNSFIFSLAGSSRTPSQRAVARCWGDLRAGFGDFGSSGSSGWGSWGGQQRGGEAAALATSSWGRAAAVDKSRESGPVVKVERAATSTQNRSRRRRRRSRLVGSLVVSLSLSLSLSFVPVHEFLGLGVGGSSGSAAVEEDDRVARLRCRSRGRRRRSRRGRSSRRTTAWHGRGRSRGQRRRGSRTTTTWRGRGAGVKDRRR